MEPRLLRRGNNTGIDCPNSARRASMEPRLLRRGNLLGTTCACAWSGLQWSHAFSDVETASVGINRASIASLQWSHAFSDVETGDPVIASFTPGGFNGATPSQTWKPILRAAGDRIRDGSFNGATPSQTWKPLRRRD